MNPPINLKPRSQCLQELIKRRLPELLELEQLFSCPGANLYPRILGLVPYGDEHLPIYAIDIGERKLGQPKLFLCGGVHGLERIGTQVVLSLLRVWQQRLKWEKSLQECFQQISATLVPIVNPVGMLLNRRANGNGVDLMRNAPIESIESGVSPVKGQRLASWLPWFRGKGELEPENQFMEQEIARLTETSPVVVSLDCHSGFGFVDRIWFPYAYRRRPMKDIAPVMALKLLWESSYPNHRYVFEPQSNHYLTHGDLWDFFYKRYGRQSCRFLPMTLEMGSWNWVKKRPLQLFQLQGLFNPMVPHRIQRTLRRHLPLMDFLRHAVQSYQNWVPEESEVETLAQMAYSLWYQNQ